MIGRFFYHAFWNFYDYLGTLTLAGVVSGFVLFAGTFALSMVGTSIPWFIYFGLLGILCVGVISLTLSGLLNLTGEAAHGNAARWPDFKAGLKKYFSRVLWVTLCWTIVQLVLLFNLWFYLKIGIQSDLAPIVRWLIIGASGIVAWIAATWYLLLAPWLALSASDEWPGLLGGLKKALMALTVLPGMWIITGMIVAFLLGGAWFLPFLLILIIPIFASLAQTAYFLTQQHYQFMLEANESLSGNTKLAALKHAARELAYAWEARQPKRTLKELYKPWQM